MTNRGSSEKGERAEQDKACQTDKTECSNKSPGGENESVQRAKNGKMGGRIVRAIPRKSANINRGGSRLSENSLQTKRLKKNERSTKKGRRPPRAKAHHPGRSDHNHRGITKRKTLLGPSLDELSLVECIDPQQQQEGPI